MAHTDYINQQNYFFNPQNAGALCHGYAVRELNSLPYVAFDALVHQGDKYFGQVQPLQDHQIDPLSSGRLASILTDRTFSRVLKFLTFTYAGNLLRNGAWRNLPRKALSDLPHPQNVSDAWNPKGIGTQLALTFDYTVQTAKSLPQLIYSTGKLAAKTASLVPVIYKHHQWKKTHGPSLTDSYAENVHRELSKILQHPTALSEGVSELIQKLPPSFFEAIASEDSEGAIQIAKMSLWKFGLHDNNLYLELFRLVAQILSDPKKLFEDKEIPDGVFEGLLLQKLLLNKYRDRTKQYDEARLLLTRFLGNQEKLPDNTLDTLLLTLPEASILYLEGQTKEAKELLEKGLSEHGIEDKSTLDRIITSLPLDDPDIVHLAKTWNNLDQIEEKRHELAATWAEKMRIIEKDLWPQKEPSNQLLTLSPDFFTAYRKGKKKQAEKTFQFDFKQRGIKDQKELKELWETIFNGLQSPTARQIIDECLDLNESFVTLKKQLTLETNVLAPSLNKQLVKEPVGPIVKRTWRSGTSALQGLVALAGLLPFLRFSPPPEGEQIQLDQEQFLDQLPVRMESRIPSAIHRTADWMERSADWAIKGGAVAFGGWKLYQLGSSCYHSIRQKTVAKEKFGAFFKDLHLYAMTVGSQNLVPTFATQTLDHTFPSLFHQKTLSENGVTTKTTRSIAGIKITPENAVAWGLQAPALMMALYNCSALTINVFRARRAIDDEKKLLFQQRKVQHWNSFKKIYGFALYNHLVLPFFKMHAKVTASGLHFGADSYQFGVKNAWQARQVGLGGLRNYALSCPECDKQTKSAIQKLFDFTQHPVTKVEKNYDQFASVVPSTQLSDEQNHALKEIITPNRLTPLNEIEIEQLKSSGRHFVNPPPALSPDIWNQAIKEDLELLNTFNRISTDKLAHLSESQRNNILKLFSTSPKATCLDCSPEKQEKVDNILKWLKAPYDLTKKEYRKWIGAIHPDKNRDLSEGSYSRLEALFRTFVDKYDHFLNHKKATANQEMTQVPAKPLLPHEAPSTSLHSNQ